MLKKLKITKRRLIQEYHGRNTHPDGSAAQEDGFENSYTNFLKTENALTSLKANLSVYAKALENLASAQEAISKDLMFFYDPETEFHKAAQTYQENIEAFKEYATKTAVDKIADDIVTPIDNHLGQFPVIKSMMDKRSRKKIDLDSYKRQLTEIQEKAGKEDKKKKVELKLKATQDKFNELSANLFSTFSRYEQLRSNLLNSHFVELLVAQLNYFNDGCESIASMEDIIARLETDPDNIHATIAEDEDEVTAAGISEASATSAGENLVFFDNPPFIASVPFATRHAQMDPMITNKRARTKYHRSKSIRNPEVAALKLENMDIQGAADSDDELPQEQAEQEARQRKEEKEKIAAEQEEAKQKEEEEKRVQLKMKEVEEAKQKEAALEIMEKKIEEQKRKEKAAEAANQVKETGKQHAVSQISTAEAFSSFKNEFISQAHSNETTDEWEEEDVVETPAPTSAPALAPDPDTPKVCVALYDYQAQRDVELSFQAGEEINVVQQDPSGWWTGIVNGQCGVFPTTYTQLKQT
mmetsp:Transcript_37369/g.73498  ORF Transcript_37369/g.73498 Transcript_37369/m.73498 type:complete len:527 (-) Transcript_37369:365-1945(-)|eukprot:CAMPEP_0175130310 /NCGR_PEP_ID=MMETSP0087-20121206/5941_1 /TAXON_ID=136419 /ORGANISM="Unknown Unknown, Strain D1" /LENGTH=526 /DNA_ID=CAMNT_0016412525 /DNA_START=23 /DNA_END=1603 /DNA_ORIENTATION=-